MELNNSKFLFRGGYNFKAWEVILDELVKGPKSSQELLDAVNERVDRPDTNDDYGIHYIYNRLQRLQEMGIVTKRSAKNKELENNGVNHQSNFYYEIVPWREFRDSFWSPLRRELKKKVFEPANEE